MGGFATPYRNVSPQRGYGSRPMRQAAPADDQILKKDQNGI